MSISLKNYSIMPRLKSNKTHFTNLQKFHRSYRIYLTTYSYYKHQSLLDQRIAPCLKFLRSNDLAKSEYRFMDKIGKFNRGPTGQDFIFSLDQYAKLFNFDVFCHQLFQKSLDKLSIDLVSYIRWYQGALLAVLGELLALLLSTTSSVYRFSENFF